MLFENRIGHRVALSPQKLLEIEREHVKSVFLGRNQNLRSFFRNTRKCPGFQIIVSPVFQKCFEGLARLREKLNLVKNNQGLSLKKSCAVLQLQLHEERI